MDEQFDFVVVGSGGGSMSAALVMREAGKSVLILEKTELVGGSTAKSGGVMWIPNNRFNAAEGIEDSLEKAELYLNSVVEAREGDAPGTSREKRRTYIVEANAMIDYLMKKGVPFEKAPRWPDYYDDNPGGMLTRTVHAKLFNVNELGEWKHKLRPNSFPYPLPIFDGVLLPLIKRSWTARRLGGGDDAARLAGQADRQEMGDGGRGAARPDAPGRAQRRRGHPHRSPCEGNHCRERRGHRDRHREGWQALARRRAARRAAQRGRLCAQPGDARPVHPAYPQGMDPCRRGRHRRHAQGADADRRGHGPDGGDGRQPDVHVAHRRRLSARRCSSPSRTPSWSTRPACAT